MFRSDWRGHLYSRRLPPQTVDAAVTYELEASSTGTATVVVAPATLVYELVASSSATATVVVAQSESYPLVASSSATATTTVVASGAFELVSGTDAGYALRFYASNTADVDRVRIPLTSGGGTVATAANVGASSFTYELWIKCAYANNASTSTTDWRYSNVLLDRDIWSDSRGHGLGVTRSGGSLVPVFGVAGVGLDHVSIVGTTNIGDSAWHFIVIDRNASTGLIRLGVDGTWEDSDTYTTGTLAYPTSYTPSGGQDNEYIVLGQEKHDVSDDDGYNGTIGFLRLSTARRYTGGSFTVPTVIPETDASTGALYLFNDGGGTTLNDYASGNTDGALLVGGANSGPAWIGSDLSWTVVNATAVVAAIGIYELIASSSATATVVVAAATLVYDMAAASSASATVVVAASGVYELIASSTGTATVEVTPATLIYELVASSSASATVEIVGAGAYELIASSSATATVVVAAATLVYELVASSSASADVVIVGAGSDTTELAASSTATATVVVAAATLVYELVASSSASADVVVSAAGVYELVASSSSSATVVVAPATLIYELVASSSGTATVVIVGAGSDTAELVASSTGTATVVVAQSESYALVASSTGDAAVVVSAAGIYELIASSMASATATITVAALLYLVAAASTGTATVVVTAINPLVGTIVRATTRIIPRRSSTTITNRRAIAETQRVGS